MNAECPLSYGAQDTNDDNSHDGKDGSTKAQSWETRTSSLIPLRLVNGEQPIFFVHLSMFNIHHVTTYLQCYHEIAASSFQQRKGNLYPLQFIMTDSDSSS